MGHKFEVIDQVLVLLGWILLELLQFLLENVEMNLELFLVVFAASLYLVLQLGESHGLFKLVKGKGFPVVITHQVGHHRMLVPFLGRVSIWLWPCTSGSPLVRFYHAKL
jgi:hypothetical protein